MSPIIKPDPMAVTTPPDTQYPHSGMKRSFSSLENSPESKSTKRPRSEKHTHHLRHRQSWAVDPATAPQDDALAERQLLRAIIVGLQAQGYDASTDTALEMFRGLVQEYMLKFLSHVRASMQSCGRTETIPNDFAMALANEGIHYHSMIKHLDQPFPNRFVQPSILSPPPPEQPPPNLAPILGPELILPHDKTDRPYIPSHFPALPSKHTYQATPVYITREEDPRKIRERATEEGVLAEQALRKLMAAKKAGLQKQGAARPQISARKQKDIEMWEKCMAAIEEDDKEEEERVRQHERAMQEEAMDWAYDGVDERREEPKVEPGGVVNYERKYWRKSVQGQVWR